VSGSPGELYTIDLQAPFWYDGQHNLLIELSWDGAAGSFHTYLWNSPVSRFLVSDCSDATIT